MIVRKRYMNKSLRSRVENWFTCINSMELECVKCISWYHDKNHIENSKLNFVGNYICGLII